jgi:hypothetical protein
MVNQEAEPEKRSPIKATKFSFDKSVSGIKEQKC